MPSYKMEELQPVDTQAAPSQTYKLEDLMDVDTQTQGVSNYERFAAMNLASTPEAAIKWLKKQHPDWDVKQYGEGWRIAVKKPGEQKHTVVDPERTELRDIADIAGEAIPAITSGIGAGLGLFGGSLPGAAVGSAIGGGVGEGVRAAGAKLLEPEMETFSPERVGTEIAMGVAAPVVGKVAAPVVKIAGKALGYAGSLVPRAIAKGVERGIEEPMLPAIERTAIRAAERPINMAGESLGKAQATQLNQSLEGIKSVAKEAVASKLSFLGETVDAEAKILGQEILKDLAKPFKSTQELKGIIKSGESLLKMTDYSPDVIFQGARDYAKTKAPSIPFVTTGRKLMQSPATLAMGGAAAGLIGLPHVVGTAMMGMGGAYIAGKGLEKLAVMLASNNAKARAVSALITNVGLKKAWDGALGDRAKIYTLLQKPEIQQALKQVKI